MIDLNKPILVLIENDKNIDQERIKNDIQKITGAHEIYIVNTGNELQDCLYQRGGYENKKEFQLPGLILLDLNVPQEGGLEALQKIKADSQLGKIPIVVFNTSVRSLQNNSPHKNSFEALVNSLSNLSVHWPTSVHSPEEAAPETENLHISHSIEKETCHLFLVGKFIFDHENNLLNVIHHLNKTEFFKKVILHFSDVDYINSTGFTMLFDAHQELENLGIKLEITHLNDELHHIFLHLGVEQVIPVISTK